MTSPARRERRPGTAALAQIPIQVTDMNRALLFTLLLAASLNPEPSAALSGTTHPASERAPDASIPAGSSTMPAPRGLEPSLPGLEPARLARASLTLPGAPKEAQAFLERVFQKLPPASKPPPEYKFFSWSVGDKPTEEGVGVMPMPGVNPEKFIARVMDVDHYLNNIERVVASRSIPDPAFKPPQQVRFYQLVDVSPIGKVQQELALIDAGVIQGYRVAYWYLLKDRTDKLNPDQGARSQYNVGAWIVAPGVVAYALSSAPRREDVNWVQWKALTSGANLAASSVVKTNIEGMSKWAAKVK